MHSLSDWESPGIPDLVENLPRLQNLGIVSRQSAYHCVDDLVEGKTCPLLKYVLRDLATTVGCKFSITIWSQYWLTYFHSYYGEKFVSFGQKDQLCRRRVNELSVLNFRKAVVGDFSSKWEMTEGLRGSKIFEDSFYGRKTLTENDFVLQCRQF